MWPNGQWPAWIDFRAGQAQCVRNRDTGEAMRPCITLRRWAGNQDRRFGGTGISKGGFPAFTLLSRPTPLGRCLSADPPNSQLGTCHPT